MDDRLAGRALALGAFLGLALGAGLVLAPATVVGLFGFETSPTAEFLARLLGAESIGFALIGVWLGADRRVRQPIVRAHLVAESLSAIVAVLAIRAGGGGGIVWLIPLLYGGFALVWAYLLVALPRN
ncbi:MAG: hypothetical protein ACKOKE_03680 [Actinomycetota bacterium]